MRAKENHFPPKLSCTFLTLVRAHANNMILVDKIVIIIILSQKYQTTNRYNQLETMGCTSTKAGSTQQLLQRLSGDLGHDA